MITPSLRDGLLSPTYSRHFVPGYHRAVPPGQGRQTAIKLTPIGLKPAPKEFRWHNPASPARPN